MGNVPGEWGVLGSVHSFPRYIGMGWTQGHIPGERDSMGRTGIRPFLPTVHWDGMDTGTYTRRAGQYGAYWDPSIPSHGILGWDGHRDIYPENGTVWDVLGSVHSFPRYIGMGWTQGHIPGERDSMGRTGIRPFLPTVHWDGMDTGTYTRRMGQYGMYWDPSIPSHGTLGWDGMDTGTYTRRMGQYETYWDPSIPSHGTLGWDGHRDIYPENGTVWGVLGSVHSFPWYMYISTYILLGDL